MTKSNQQTLQEYTFQGSAYVFEGVTLNVSGYPTLAHTGNDSRNILQPFNVPRPTAGTLLSYFDDLVERRSCKLSGIPVGGDPTAFAEFELSDHVMSLEGQGTFTADPIARAVFRFTTTSPGAGLTRQTRSASVTARTLLVLRIDRNKPIREFVEFHYYYRVGIRPADEHLGTKENQPFDFFALVGCRLDDDDCLTEDFNLFGKISIDSDGVNTLITS